MPAKANSDLKGLSAQTKRLLTGEEGLEVDFKRNRDGVNADDYVSLANSTGGIILVGVDEVISAEGSQTGKVVGCSTGEKVKRSLINIAKSCKPAITVHIRRENTSTKSRIFRIEVPEGEEKPYCTGVEPIKLERTVRTLESILSF